MKKISGISGVILIIILTFSAGCKKTDQGQLPEIFTTRVHTVMPNSAICDGEITANGGSRLSEQGVCWSTGHMPVITDNKIMLPFRDVCKYTVTITGLSQHTDYYVRAYATNSLGTAYGEELPFTTLADHTGEKGTIEDADGNVYQTIGIWSQIWMAENLKTTRYRNGDLIGTTTPATLDITAGDTAKYQWAYDGDESNVSTYGRLYTLFAVTDNRSVCPTGWHVPTDAEWTTLTTFLDGDVRGDGAKLKETGTTHWLSPNAGATNETGFTALPCGYRSPNGAFGDIGISDHWWSSTEVSSSSAWIRTMYYDNTSVARYSYSPNGQAGYSVRCLQD